MSDAQVAVLGGGISGCLTACLLADQGLDVLIVEQRAQLVDAASRWNDGKLHLGFTFTGTASLATAELLQQGAGLFVPVLERITGVGVSESMFGAPVIYLVDRDSLVDAEILFERARAVASMPVALKRLPGLPASIPSVPPVERLGIDEAIAETSQEHIMAAWRTGEHHVSPREVAVRIRNAVAEREIPIVHARVQSVRATTAGWGVSLDGGPELTARVLVNCLWENRAWLDWQVERRAVPTSIRYKHALFGEATGLAALTPSTRILGRYGDIATYGNGDAYLSWYPAALAGRSDDGLPPTIPERDERTVRTGILDGLGLPDTTLSTSARWQVCGGFVVAYGHGDIDDLQSPLHHRDRPGVRVLRPGFVSVDTGKYTLGPLMALRAAAAVCDTVRRSSSWQRLAPSGLSALT